ncbi:hypothetical protein L7F22_029997 [Adiantum nelumboides]|nr:hypothetical protein [Adiantum nelumboides]
MALRSPIECISLPCNLPSRVDAARKPHSFVRPNSLLSHRLSIAYQSFRGPSRWVCLASTPSPGPLDSSDAHDEDELDVEQALHLDGQIPSTSDALLKQVSSRAYDMRRQLEQSKDSSSYDVLETNPWREDTKPVYVLAQEENKLLTMRTRRARSEVENELSLLFPKRGSRRGFNGLPRSSSSPSMPAASSPDTRFRMVVEDVREGVLVFEDEKEATQYCNLLDGQGKGCMGVAELDASDVFALCKSIKAFAVLFRRGRIPPLPERLQLNLKARKQSLED